MRKLLVMLLVVAMAFMVLGCEEKATPAPTAAPTAAAPTAAAATAAPTAAPAPEAKSFVLKYNILEPAEHPQGIAMLKFAEKIEELSGGQIKCETYPSAQLFTQEGEVQALTNGDLHMSNISFQDISPYLPEAGMFAAPYAFTSYEHYEKVFAKDSEVAADFYSRVEKACNYTPIGTMTQGMRIINTKSETPVVKPEDLKGTILRMPNAPAWIAAGESLGASVTPIAYAECYTALQTGTVDAQDNPLAGTYAMKFYEVTKQISLTKHIIDVKLICVNTDVWNEMTEQQQQWMIDAADYAGKLANEATYASEEELLTFMRDEAKLIITEPDIAAFQAASLKYYQDKGLTADWDMDLYNHVQAVK